MRKILFSLVLGIVISSIVYAQGELFFPQGIFSADEKTDTDKKNWFIKVYEIMQEESLWQKKDLKGIHNYRLFYIPQWAPAVCLYLDINDQQGAELIVKMTDSQGINDLGKLDLNKTVQLSKKQAQDILNLFEEANYWQLPSNLPGSGLEATQWVLEGIKEGKYHLVEGWGPKDEAFRKIGFALIELADLTYDPAKGDGPYKFYYENGQLKKEVTYKKGRQEGISKSYYNTGSLQTEWNMEDGKVEGVFKSFYPDGTLGVEATFQLGKPSGFYKSYYPDGKLQMELIYLDGQLNGVAKWYNQDGSLQKEAQYKDNQIVND